MSKISYRIIADKTFCSILILDYRIYYTFCAPFRCFAFAKQHVLATRATNYSFASLGTLTIFQEPADGMHEKERLRRVEE